jgi:hypothetical protein
VAICGDQCTITAPSGVYEAHKYSINIKGTEENVRRFGSGRFGDWLSCAAEGSIVINHYLQIPNLKVGDTCSVTLGIGTVTLTATNCRVMDITCDVDAKAVVEWTTTVKLTGVVTGW